MGRRLGKATVAIEANGLKLRINTYTKDSQNSPSVTGLSDGGFVVMWESFGQDGDRDSVYGRRFPPGTVIRRGTDGNDTIERGAAPDFIEGLAGNDRLTGGAGVFVGPVAVCSSPRTKRMTLISSSTGG